jgi:LemA protein
MSGKMKMGCLVIGALFVGFILITGVVLWRYYNGIIERSESVNSQWSQVENVYQRRYDLIPNLVETVKGYAGHERETLEAVTNARSKVGGVMNLSPDMLNNPQALEQFSQAQAGLAGALQRLMVVVERYPDLKANESFLALQSQLEGTENRIAVERMKFNEVVQVYNVFVKKFPRIFIARLFGYGEKAYFKANADAQEAPRVSFEK